MKVTRAKFTDKAAFDSWKESNSIDGVLHPDIVSIVEIGPVRLLSYDEQGNMIEGELIEDHHVDFMSTEIIQSLKDVTIEVDHPVHGVSWAEGCELVNLAMYD